MLRHGPALSMAAALFLACGRTGILAEPPGSVVDGGSIDSGAVDAGRLEDQSVPVADGSSDGPLLFEDSSPDVDGPPGCNAESCANGCCSNGACVNDSPS